MARRDLYDEEDAEEGGPAGKVNRDRMTHMLEITAASRVARDVPDALGAARSTREVDHLRAEQADEIGARLAGISVPKTLVIRRRLMRARGISERIDGLASRQRLILMAARPGDVEPDHRVASPSCQVEGCPADGVAYVAGVGRTTCPGHVLPAIAGEVRFKVAGADHGL